MRIGFSKVTYARGSKVLIDQVSYAFSVEIGSEYVNGLLSIFQNRTEQFIICTAKNTF
jgi:hypothetical protein